MDINKKIATRQSYGEALSIIGEENKDIVVLDADLSGATKTNIFANHCLQKRAINVFSTLIARFIFISFYDKISTAGSRVSAGS